MLIRNYGLFWRRDDVHWGAQRNAGTLLGKPAGQAKKKPTDFRYQQGVYCLYDDNFRLVYVGQAGAGEAQRLFARLKNHTVDHMAARWSRFSWFGTLGVLNDGTLQQVRAAAHPSMDIALNQIEGVLIAAAEPPLNKQGARFGKTVLQFLQWRDEAKLGPELPEMVYDVWKNGAVKKNGKARR